MCDLTRPHDETIMWLYGYKSIKTMYHPAKFSGHSLSGSGVTKILVFRVIKGSCDFMVWTLMVSHHPAKFGGHRHYGNGDMFSVGICLEGQNSGWPCLDPSLLFILRHAYTHKISGGRHNNLLVCPMKDSRSWSHMSTRTTEQPVCPKTVPGIRKRNKRMAIAKLFCVLCKC